MGFKKLSWEDIENVTSALGDKIKASGFEADYIVGVANGGLVPLGLLVKKLRINKIFIVAAQSYEKEERKDLVITYLPEANLSGKKVLIVDDIADSGKTLRKISAILSDRYGAKEIKTAVLAINSEKTAVKPDFSILEKNEWIVFPWEKEEFPKYF